MTPQIMLAKLTAPQPGSVFTRKRLFNQLDTMTQHPVNWISAPAGSGKTTLILSYLQQQKIAPLWYRIDEGDHDPTSLFYHLNLLAHQISLEQSRLPRLTSEQPSSLSAFTRNFFRIFYGRLPNDTVLVFDNYPDAETANPLHTLLPVILQEIPPHVRVVFISRSNPPNELTSLLTSGYVQTLNWQHLQFTEEEIDRLCKLRRPENTLRETDICKLHSQTQGWATGLILILSHPLDKQHLRTLNNSQSQADIFRYFSNEVFQHANDDEKDVLLKTAFLQQIKVGSAEQLTGNSNCGNILQNFVHRNYFTVQLTDTIQTYAYHPLFREFLLSMISTILKPDDLIALKIKSAKLLQNDNYYDDAANIYISSKTWPELSRLVINTAENYIRKGLYHTLQKWLAAIPQCQLNIQPWLWFWYGASYQPFDAKKSSDCYLQAYKIFKSKNITRGQILCLCGAIDAYAYSWQELNNLDRWIREGENILIKNPELLESNSGKHFSCSMFLALMFREPENRGILKWEKHVREIVLQGPPCEPRTKIAPMLLLYFTWIKGDLNTANIIFDLIHTNETITDISPLFEITTKIFCANYLWKSGNANLSLEYSKQATQLANESKIHNWDIMINAQYICAASLKKNYPLVKKYIKKLKQLQKNNYFDRSMYHYMLAWHAHDRGENYKAYTHAIISYDESKKTGMKAYVLYCHIILLKCQFASGKRDATYKEIEYILKQSKQSRIDGVQLLCWLTKADFAYYYGDPITCFKALKKYIKLASNRGFLVMQNYATQINYLIAFALDSNIGNNYFHKVIRTFNIPPPTDHHLSQVWPYPVKIYTLGRFHIQINGDAVEPCGKTQKKPLELLKALIALGGRDVRDDQLTEILWPDAEGDAAYSNLKTTVNRLRKLLANKQAITFIEGKLNLDQKYCWLDCWAFEHMIEKTDNTDAQLEKILAIYRGNFFTSEADNHWLLAPRERLRRKFINAIVTLGEHHEQQKHWTSAIDIYLKGLHTDDLVEIFYQGLIRCYNTLGNQSEAIRTYQQCDETLQSQLSVKPSALTEKLLTEIRGKS